MNEPESRVLNKFITPEGTRVITSYIHTSPSINDDFIALRDTAYLLALNQVWYKGKGYSKNNELKVREHVKKIFLEKYKPKSPKQIVENIYQFKNGIIMHQLSIDDDLTRDYTETEPQQVEINDKKERYQRVRTRIGLDKLIELLTQILSDKEQYNKLNDIKELKIYIKDDGTFALHKVNK